MAQFDLPLDQLREYRPPRDEPADFDAFWASTLAASRAKRAAPVLAEVETGLETIAAADVTFSGFDGQPIKAWLLWPAGRTGPLPTMVEYIGYGGGRGEPYEWLLWASAGYAHLVMDTRGQGGTWQGGDTSDIDESGTGSQAPGVMSRGILDPATYYYRRLMTDAVLAVDAARDMPIVDASRIAVIGGSQGGGLALTVAGLAEGLAGAIVDVPFLTHFRRALEVTDEDPYGELRLYLRTPSPGGGAGVPHAVVLRRPQLRRPRDGAGAVLGRARGRHHAAVDGVRRVQRVRRARRRSASGPSTATRRPRTSTPSSAWRSLPASSGELSRRPRHAKRTASRSAIALMIALVVAGCWGGERLQGPTLAIRNDTAEPVVVRVQRSRWRSRRQGRGTSGPSRSCPRRRSRSSIRRPVRGSTPWRSRLQPDMDQVSTVPASRAASSRATTIDDDAASMPKPSMDPNRCVEPGDLGRHLGRKPLVDDIRSRGALDVG